MGREDLYILLVLILLYARKIIDLLKLGLL